MLNIPKADLGLRRDIVFALQKHAITAEMLCFVEDFEALDQSLVDLVLVDHCAPQGELRALTNVIAIIDHHDDEGLFLGASPRIVEKAGSCSSLVFNYWDQLLTNKRVFSEVVDLLVAPLLADTSNMSSKVEPADTTAFARYAALDPHRDFTAYADELKAMKKDLSGMSFGDLLRKDYKGYECPTANGEILRVGISSMPKSFRYMFKHYDTIETSVKAWGEDQRLDLVCMMANDNKGEFERQIAFYDLVGGSLSRLVEDQLREELRLETMDVSHAQESFTSVRFAKQLNVAASRKQVAPAMKRAISQL